MKEKVFISAQSSRRTESTMQGRQGGGSRELLITLHLLSRSRAKNRKVGLDCKSSKLTLNDVLPTALLCLILFHNLFKQQQTSVQTPESVRVIFKP